MAEDTTSKPVSGEAADSTQTEDKPSEISPKTEANETGTNNRAGADKQEKLEIPTEDLNEEATKRAFLSKFRRKHKANKKQVDEAQPDEERTNQSAEDTAEALYKHIAELKASDYWVIRIKKKKVLWLFGFVILGMWIVVAYRMLEPVIRPQAPFLYPYSAVEPEAETPVLYTYGVRVRANSTELSQAEQVKSLLTSAGFGNVEVVEDTETEIREMSVVVKSNNEEVREQIQRVLESTYSLASPSAELTQDSDFEAVIFFTSLGLVEQN